MQFWPFNSLKSAPAESLPSLRQQLQLRILSFNIRYATSSPFTNEKPWHERLPLVMNQVHHETRFMNGESSNTNVASIICLQEVLHTQLIDIMHSLNSNTPSTSTYKPPTNAVTWAHVGVGRDDGQTKGEYSPIIYPTNIFNLLHSETVWLSPTPDRPSKGWDAGSIRILTVAVLECKTTAQRVLATCTHLDNAGSESRKHSVEVILKTLKRVEKEWAKGGKLAIFLAGDFNLFTDQEAYLLLAQSGYMYDLRDLVEEKRRYNDGITFTGFEPEKDRDEQGRIDFIWLGPKGSVSGADGFDERLEDAKQQWGKVDGYAVLPNVFDDGIYLSDHRCVVGDVRLLG